ncbi:MAG: NfeD family protein [Clostridiales bacterium]|nr:NfeD family protein [Clostridiales bacterium]
MDFWGITIGLAAFWIAAAVILIIIEAATMGLTTIWFAGGAIAAAISTLFTSNIFVQIAVFIVVSVALLYLTKPLKAKLKIGKEKTNVEAIVGKTGFVVDAISPAAYGQVKVGSMVWTSKSADPKTLIAAGTEIVVVSVEGVKLVVAPANG